MITVRMRRERSRTNDDARKCDCLIIRDSDAFRSFIVRIVKHNRTKSLWDDSRTVPSIPGDTTASTVPGTVSYCLIVGEKRNRKYCMINV